MKNVLVTGASGFIGKNLTTALKQMDGIALMQHDISDSTEVLEEYIKQADFVFHLAGVHRPPDEREFQTGNTGFTEQLLDIMDRCNYKETIVYSSSIQAVLNNPYGRSKKAAEEAITAWAEKNGSKAYIYRLTNVFGKWARPDYNSVVATFCHNIACNLPIKISNPEQEIKFVYIDDVVEEFINALKGTPNMAQDGFCHIPRVFKISLAQLAETIRSFKKSRETVVLPDFSSDLIRFLYATYTSYLDADNLEYAVEIKEDNRGWLAELLKSKSFGQIFISRTKPGIKRGNHWHHTKAEKFVVLEGKAVIKLMNLNGGDVIEIPVEGDNLKIVDIPAGYAHSIENTGHSDLVTLFYANEIFDKQKPDTYFAEV
ncbi:MAG: NAD-dependent epimerase/dehydratase family protein [Clostridia bacterium]|nr:NAD-dependent epimerase/dehydratase family protein [Clostridia bacterium]